MFDLRYHVASLAAVFLALVIGILVGVAISGRSLIRDSERAVLQNDIAELAGPAGDAAAPGRAAGRARGVRAPDLPGRDGGPTRAIAGSGSCTSGRRKARSRRGSERRSTSRAAVQIDARAEGADRDRRPRSRRVADVPEAPRHRRRPRPCARPRARRRRRDAALGRRRALARRGARGGQPAARRRRRRTNRRAAARTDGALPRGLLLRARRRRRSRRRRRDDGQRADRHPDLPRARFLDGRRRRHDPGTGRARRPPGRRAPARTARRRRTRPVLPPVEPVVPPTG